MITEKNIKRAKKYCKDDYRKIPGYERALKESGKFDIHHVLELTLEGQYAHSTEELKRLQMYYCRPYFELQWMMHTEHMALHAKFSPTMIGEKSGKKNPRYGKVSFRGEKEKNPMWKGDSVGPMGAYRRARKLYKEGKISEEELQPYRDKLNEYRIAKKKQSGVQSSENLMD